MTASTDLCSQKGMYDGSPTSEIIGNPDSGAAADAGATATPPQDQNSYPPALPIDLEDEVSWVVHEFRRQGSPIHSMERGRNANPSIHSTTRKKKLYPGYFSEVRYHSDGEIRKRQRNSHEKRDWEISRYGPFVEVSYLFDKVLSLKFRVYIQILDRGDGAKNGCENKQGDDFSNKKNSYTTFVSSVDLSDDADDVADCFISRSLTREQGEIWRRRIRAICDVLNDKHSEKSKSSLFAVLSKLLLSLNQLQTEVLNNNTSKQDTNSPLPPLTDRQKSFHLECLLGKGRSAAPTVPGGVDLAILLLRCAAMGKYGELFSHPFPPAAKGDLIADRIWKATERHQRFQRHRQKQQLKDSRKSRQSQNKIVQGNAKSPMRFHPSEHELLGLFCSLPWMKQGRITVTRTRFEKDDIVGTRANEARRIVFEVCLHLNDNHNGHEAHKDALHSPRFARACGRHGGLTVYHGTHMQNAWSILHNGFFNPSEIGRGGKEFIKNGAMLGSGIYLSTSQKTATFFATQGASIRTVRSALQGDSVKNLLSMACDIEDLQLDSIQKFYDVSCFSVFEARIVRPPENEWDPTDHDPSAQTRNRQNPRKKHANGNSSSSTVGTCSKTTRRDGKYFVVPDERDVRITKLHLTFELTRRERGATSFLLPEFLSTRLRLIAMAVFGLLISYFIVWHDGSSMV